MSTLTSKPRKPSIYDAHPELRITPEELKKRNERTLKVLESFENSADAAEQRETGEFLMNALAEARESNRECRE